ncbi:MAG: M56 family metallopeptidase [Alphaproteobacteria bacterium]|nr:M56 family metallopeptidase [Alphaproteobacteria bacterium]
MIAGVADHLWQSTLFAVAAGLLTLVLRHNGARARFWLWFAASLKFLLPFTILAALGEWLGRLAPLPRVIIPQAAQQLSAPARTLAVPHAASLAPNLPLLLLGVWLLGLGMICGLRLVRWRRLQALIHAARDISLPRSPVTVKASASLLEPGLVGILKPVVLLPQDLMSLLSERERDSILAHELGHLRRRDNVTAAIHMAVEALFWFYPPVWLIGARLIAERERACDESVLADGHDPETYAGGILKVCKFCIQSPLACAPGATGADLKGRVRQIMTGAAARRLGLGKRALLAGAAALALGLPVMAGLLDSPLAVEVQRQVAAVRSQVTDGIARHVAAVRQEIGVTPQQVQPPRLPRMTVVTVVAPVPLPELAPQPQMLAPVASTAPAMPLPKSPPVAETQAVPVTGTREAVLALYPSGAGEPDAITCRVPQLLPGSRLPGPEVCKINRVWAQLRAEGKDISPDGSAVIATLSKSHAMMQPGACFNGLPATLSLSPALTFACR